MSKIPKLSCDTLPENCRSILEVRNRIAAAKRTTEGIKSDVAPVSEVFLREARGKWLNPAEVGDILIHSEDVLKELDRMKFEMDLMINKLDRAFQLTKEAEEYQRSEDSKFDSVSNSLTTGDSGILHFRPLKKTL